MKRTLMVALVLSLAGCKHGSATKTSSATSGSAAGRMTAVAAQRAVQLLPETPEKPTEDIKELRKDIEVDTRDFDRTPHVVASQETDTLQLAGQRARLFGNQAATDGFSVDNFLLFEVLDAKGQVTSRFVIGQAEGVLVNDQRLDNVGKMGFNFDAGEIDITSHLPESAPFKLRVTALDYGGVGRVSDVWLVMENSRHGTSSDDELRDR
jgi:hypothetical protein